MAKDRDFTAEITAAVQANDLSRLAGIAHYLLGKVEHDANVKARRAEKRAEQRADQRRREQEATSRPVSRRRETTGDNRDTVQGPKEQKPDNTPTARELAQVDGDAKLIRTIALAIAAYGTEWADVDLFLRRRDFVAWQGWLDEMARNVGGTSQYTPVDLGRVCRDDILLKAPIGSAFALRKFLFNARLERVTDERPPPDAAPRAPQRRRDTAPASIPAPPSDPDQPIKWT